jgi:acyl-CoA dehydrogenase
VWWDAELFAGQPNRQHLLDAPAPRLSEFEQAFIDGPLRDLCERIDDWHINHERRDLPPEIWQMLKDEGFFGMIIDKAHGGLGFSRRRSLTSWRCFRHAHWPLRSP